MKKLTLLIGLSLLIAAPSFAYVCGDANGDQAINISDAVHLINYIFKSGPVPDPLDAADVNLDGAVNVGDPVYLVNYIFRGGPTPCATPGGGMTGTSGCKNPYKSPDTLSNLDCIQYDYDGMGTLTLTHINAAFNCCPDEILVDIDIQGDTILITEDETFNDFGPCYCLCRFDVYMTVTGLMPGEYTIMINGMYLDGTAPLNTTVNLAAEPSGIYCVERDFYPWGDW
jgi:hypothetical protein